jgi:hypothetical protein
MEKQTSFQHYFTVAQELALVRETEVAKKFEQRFASVEALLNELRN